MVDRGISHLDVGCQDEAGADRWVPFEVLALAAGLWSEYQFKEDQRKWCETLDLEAGTIPEIELDKALAQIRKHRHRIVEAANDLQAVARAEATVSNITREILDVLEVDPHLQDSDAG